MLMSALKPLAELETGAEFVARHIGIDADAEAQMLAAIGAPSRRSLIEQVVPESIARATPMRLPAPLGEAEALAELKAIAAKNRVVKSFIGQGYHGTHTPGVILRNVLESPAWYTAYTPYQAEISQGRLEALVNFQTMVCDLTGMAIANASMLDEATAAAEAMTLARRSVRAPATRSSSPATPIRRRSRCCARARSRSACRSCSPTRPRNGIDCSRAVTTSRCWRSGRRRAASCTTCAPTRRASTPTTPPSSLPRTCSR
jgi:hypothetical protein